MKGTLLGVIGLKHTTLLLRLYAATMCHPNKPPGDELGIEASH